MRWGRIPLLRGYGSFLQERGLWRLESGGQNGMGLEARRPRARIHGEVRQRQHGFPCLFVSAWFLFWFLFWCFFYVGFMQFDSSSPSSLYFSLGHGLVGFDSSIIFALYLVSVLLGITIFTGVLGLIFSGVSGWVLISGLFLCLNTILYILLLHPYFSYVLVSFFLLLHLHFFLCSILLRSHVRLVWRVGTGLYCSCFLGLDIIWVVGDGLGCTGDLAAI